MNAAPGQSQTPAFIMVGLGWLLVALFIGETRLLATLPGPAPQVALWLLTLGLLLCAWKNLSVRHWVEQLPLKFLVAAHLTRFVGFYLLWLHARGELPASFAIAAAWGDISAASLATLLLFIPGLENRKALLLAWNTFGLADILMVVTSGMRLSPLDRAQVMDDLTQLPLSFLPTMVVPIIIATHVVIFARLWRSGRAKSNGTPLPAPQRLNPA